MENDNRAGHNIICLPKHNPIPQWLWQQGHLALVWQQNVLPQHYMKTAFVRLKIVLR